MIACQAPNCAGVGALKDSRNHRRVVAENCVGSDAATGSGAGMGSIVPRYPDTYQTAIGST